MNKQRITPVGWLARAFAVSIWIVGFMGPAEASVMSSAGYNSASTSAKEQLRFPMASAELGYLVKVDDNDNSHTVSAGDTLRYADTEVSLSANDVATNSNLARALSKVRGHRTTILSFSGKRYIVAEATKHDEGGMVVTTHKSMSRFVSLEPKLPTPANLCEMLGPRRCNNSEIEDKLNNYSMHYRYLIGAKNTPTQIFAMGAEKAWKSRWQVASYARHYRMSQAIVEALLSSDCAH